MTTTTTTAVAPPPPVVIAPPPPPAATPVALPAAMPAPPLAEDPDTVAILASDLAFGPSMEDADVTARYYCSMKGKLPTFISRENPPELHAPSLLVGIKPTFTVMIYHCVMPGK